MAITLTGQKVFFTNSNAAIGNNVPQFSVSTFFRFEPTGTPSQAISPFLTARDFYSSFYIQLTGAGSAGKVKTTLGLVGASGASAKTQPQVSVGDVHHFAMTWDQGAQIGYVDGVPTVMGSMTGNTYNASRHFLVGGWDISPGPNCIFTLSDVATWNNYVLTPTEVANLRDGVQTPDQIGVSASLRGRWTLAGPTGATPALGDSGLANFYGNATYNLSNVGGTGSSVYADPLVWSSPATLRSAYVGMSGKTVECLFQSRAGGGDALPQTCYTMPTILRNGTDIGQLQDPYISGHHKSAVFMLPSATSVAPGDVVTLRAPNSWMATDIGLSDGLADLTIGNNTGRSCFGSDALAKSLRPGLNFAAEATADDCIYNLPKNWRFRLGGFQGATKDANGKPIAMAGTTAVAALWSVTADNGIDATLHAGPTGLFAIGWDDLNPSVPTTFALNTADGGTSHTTITERLDLANPGNPDGTGKVRVFNVQRTPGSATARIQIFVWMTNSAKTPQFDNLVVYEPGDFDYADSTPTVLDKSLPNQLSLCATARSRLGGVAGSFRWMDTLTEYAGSSRTAEPEDTRKLTDWSWGWGQVKTQRTIGYVQARPLDPAVSPYIYSAQVGSKFAATLGSPINTTPPAGTIETITVSDAATAPVFAGLRLFIDGEILRVMDVSGTTVTVERGSESSTVAAHPAGPIQVGYRIPTPAFSVLCNGNGHVTELVSSAPHYLRSGTTMNFAGSWPTFSYTDGKTDVMTNLAGVGWVTGPNSFCMGTYAGNSTAATLSQSYTLNPATNTTSWTAPGGPQLPVEYAAIATAQVPGADLHVNISHNATDALVDDWARRIRDNFPSGRTVWVELSNEPWNTGFAQWRYYGPLTSMLYPGQHYYASLVQRSKQVWQRFRDRFDENGAGRAGDIKAVLNFISTGNADCTAALNYAAAQTPPLRVDAAAIAPYIDTTNEYQMVAALKRADTQQALDLYIHWLYHDTASGGYPFRYQAFGSSLAAYNAATGYACQLIGYEGGLELPVPQRATGPGTVAVVNGATTVAGTGTKFTAHYRPGDQFTVVYSDHSTTVTLATVDSDTQLTLSAAYADVSSTGRAYQLVMDNPRERARDFQYDPNNYVVETDFYALAQANGFQRFNTFCYAYTYYQGQYLWGLYHGAFQEHGLGDGTDGKLNNRLCLAVPGQPNTKSATTNQELNTVSVRGQAWLDWNAAVTQAGGILVSPLQASAALPSASVTGVANLSPTPLVGQGTLLGSASGTALAACAPQAAPGALPPLAAILTAVNMLTTPLGRGGDLAPANVRVDVRVDVHALAAQDAMPNCDVAAVSVLRLQFIRRRRLG